MRYDCITVGSAMRDIFLFLDSRDAPVIQNPSSEATRKKLLALEFGAKIDVERAASAWGGGGLNSAVTFARMGLRTASVVCVGLDDAGDTIAAAMRHEGIGTEFVTRARGVATGFSTLIVSGSAKHDRVALAHRGASDAVNFSSKSRGITSAGWYYTTALSGGSWKRELADISSVVAKRGIRWAWNPGLVQLKAGLKGLGRFMRHAEVFNVNRDEALELVGGKDDISHLLIALLSAGPKRVIITDGIKGAYYADAGQILHISADSSIRAKEPTGAGDAFGSGFVAGLIMKNDSAYALDLGLANSESVICHVGAQAGILNKHAIKKHSDKGRHKVKKLT